MAGLSRSHRLALGALSLVLLFGACMPERVEVGRDSTLDPPAAAGDAGDAGSSDAARASGGSSSVDGDESAGGLLCGPEGRCPP